MSIQDEEEEDIPTEDDSDIPTDESSSLVMVAEAPTSSIKTNKHSGIFKPKQLRAPRTRGRPRHKNDNPCVVPMRISNELHALLSAEKQQKETFDACALRLIRERVDLRKQIEQLKRD